jgi:hypothetical protein
MILYTKKHKVPFQIDEEDYPLVSSYTWHVAGGYVRNSQSEMLHILLFGKAPQGLIWDHKNRDKLDNRRENLRPVTHVVNARNRGPRSENLAGVRGVSWFDNGRYWVAIRVKGKRYCLGTFPTIEQAATARREAEERFWGNER